MFWTVICKDYFFMSECQCDPNGSTSMECNEYGKCDWKTLVYGQKCDADCQCDPNGSTSMECDSYDGTCDCKIGFYGQNCNLNVPPQKSENFYKLFMIYNTKWWNIT